VDQARNPFFGSTPWYDAQLLTSRAKVAPVRIHSSTAKAALVRNHSSKETAAQEPIHFSKVKAAQELNRLPSTQSRCRYWQQLFLDPSRRRE
jgi:hypothetical protein